MQTKIQSDILFYPLLLIIFFSTVACKSNRKETSVGFGEKCEEYIPDTLLKEERWRIILDSVQKIDNDPSILKTTLTGVGEVYVRTVHYSKFDYWPIEMYSREPADSLIKGIERVGPFRLYNDVPIRNKSTYSGLPKIDFLGKNDAVIKTIYPLSKFALMKGSKFHQKIVSGNNENNYDVIIYNTSRLINPLYKDSINIPKGSSSTLNTTLSFYVQQKSLITNLTYYAGYEESMSIPGFESIVYDSLGNTIGRYKGFGPLNGTYVTVDNRFMYVNTGGMVNEDQSYPNSFNIVNIKEGKTMFSKNADSTECISGYTISGTNYGVYSVSKSCGTPIGQYECYVIDHSQNRIYFILKNERCKNSQSVTTFDGYCECWHKDNTKTKLFYDKDFPFEKFSDWIKH